MAKKMSEEARTNKISPDLMKKYVGQLDAIAEEKVKLHMQYMTDNKELIEEAKEIIALAKGEGLPTKPLKAIMKKRDLKQKIKDLEDDLDIDQRSIFMQMQDALGGEKGLVGLPLGNAAMKAEGVEVKSKASDEEVIAQNRAALAGIKKAPSTPKGG